MSAASVSVVHLDGVAVVRVHGRVTANDAGAVAAAAAGAGGGGRTVVVDLLTAHEVASGDLAAALLVAPAVTVVTRDEAVAAELRAHGFRVAESLDDATGDLAPPVTHVEERVEADRRAVDPGPDIWAPDPVQPRRSD